MVFGVFFWFRFDFLVNDFIDKVLRYCYFDLYQGEFCCIFLYVKDVVRVFVFLVENYKKMVGQVFNVGDENMNLLKFDVVYIIQWCVLDCYIIEFSNGEDKDKRDY